MFWMVNSQISDLNINNYLTHLKMNPVLREMGVNVHYKIKII